MFIRPTTFNCWLQVHEIEGLFFTTRSHVTTRIPAQPQVQETPSSLSLSASHSR